MSGRKSRLLYKDDRMPGFEFGLVKSPAIARRLVWTNPSLANGHVCSAARSLDEWKQADANVGGGSPQELLGLDDNPFYSLLQFLAHK